MLELYQNTMELFNFCLIKQFFWVRTIYACMLLGFNYSKWVVNCHMPVYQVNILNKNQLYSRKHSAGVTSLQETESNQTL